MTRFDSPLPGEVRTRVSGVVQFDALTPTGVQVLHDLELKGLPGVHYTFGPLPGRALLFWDSSASLIEVARLINLIATPPASSKRRQVRADSLKIRRPTRRQNLRAKDERAHPGSPESANN